MQKDHGSSIIICGFVQLGRNALILCSASFYLGMGGFGAQAFGLICYAGRRWGAELCFSSLCALLAQPLIF